MTELILTVLGLILGILGLSTYNKSKVKSLQKKDISLKSKSDVLSGKIEVKEKELKNIKVEKLEDKAVEDYWNDQLK